MMAGVASDDHTHDLNNLLSVIISYAEFALSDLGDHPAAAEVRQIRRAADEAVRLLRGVEGDAAAHSPASATDDDSSPPAAADLSRPADDDDDDALPAAGDPSPPAGGDDVLPAAGGRRVLVVDDDAGVRKVAERILATHGYEVLSAAGADAALAAPLSQIDVLLTDVLMSETSGVELARRVGERHAEVRIVFMSGLTEKPDDVPPGAAFVAKPFSRAELLRAVGSGSRGVA
jgi:CheY-like chemotaxis protein